MNSFKTQQARWAKGLIQVAKKLLPVIWRSDQPLYIKMEATFHLTSNIAYPLMILFSLILLPAIIVRFYQGWFQMLYLDLPVVYCFHLHRFRLLRRIPAGVVSPRLVEAGDVSAVPHGHGHWPRGHQRQGRHGSVPGHQVSLRSHAQVSSGPKRARVGAEEICAPAHGLDSCRRAAAGGLFRLHHGLFACRSRTTWWRRSCCCFWWVTATWERCRCCRRLSGAFGSTFRPLSGSRGKNLSRHLIGKTAIGGEPDSQRAFSPSPAWDCSACARSFSPGRWDVAASAAFPSIVIVIR